MVWSPRSSPEPCLISSLATGGVWGCHTCNLWWLYPRLFYLPTHYTKCIVGSFVYAAATVALFKTMKRLYHILVLRARHLVQFTSYTIPSFACFGAMRPVRRSVSTEFEHFCLPTRSLRVCVCTADHSLFVAFPVFVHPLGTRSPITFCFHCRTWWYTSLNLSFCNVFHVTIKLCDRGFPDWFQAGSSGIVSFRHVVLQVFCVVLLKHNFVCF